MKRHLIFVLLGITTVLPRSAGRDGGPPPGREVGDTFWREGPLDAQAVDWSLFPSGYGVLDDERMRYPVEMADWPVKIGRERQLFVDNFFVAKASAVRRTVHQPVKHPGNPIMEAEASWEPGKKILPIYVLRDPKTGKFRMWYESKAQYNKIKESYPTLYAESDDGITWVRPNLGLLEYKGSKDNNFVIFGRMYGFFEKPDAPDPAQRYLALIYEPREPPFTPREALYMYGSPDGVRWTRLREAPVMPLLHGDKTLPLGGVGDTTIVRWDSLMGRYVCDAKLAYGQRTSAGEYDLSFQTRGISTSDDLIHWTRPRMTIFPDALDPENSRIYGHVSFVYEGMRLGMLRLFHYPGTRAGWKQVDVQLTASRDGETWTRVGNREVFLPLGGSESWERDYTDPVHNGPLLVGDELWFYYRGSRNLDKNEMIHYEFAVGLAKLRRDGFVSIDAGHQTGTVQTRPLTFGGRSLHLNAAVRPGGEIKVALLNRDGSEIPEYRAANCRPITGDSTSLRVDWERGSDLSGAKRGFESIRLQFHLTNAQLYSFWID